MDTTWIWYTLLGVIYLAILYALVKPGSPGASGVTVLSNALASLVATATGSTTQSTNVPQGGFSA